MFEGDILLFCTLGNKYAWGYRMMYKINARGDGGIDPGYRCSLCQKAMPENFDSGDTDFNHEDASAVFNEVKGLIHLEKAK